MISTWSSHAHGVAKVRSEQCPVVTLFGTKVPSGTLVARNLQGAGQTEQLISEPALEPRQLGRHQRTFTRTECLISRPRGSNP